MTSAEKLQLADLPMAVVMLVMGVGFLVLRKKMSIARAERVAKGEITVAEAMKVDRMVFWGGWFITASGVFLLAMWVTGH
jgi:hypothetical protein